jgi:endogenous inhibitor of DNA gyrase (YacG/DUF329 family)
MTEKKSLMVKCPKCSSSFSYYASEYRPFCSERCKDVDLGNWFTENYKVPSKENLSEDDIEVVLKNLDDDDGEYEN